MLGRRASPGMADAAAAAAAAAAVAVADVAIGDAAEAHRKMADWSGHSDCGHSPAEGEQCTGCSC